MKVKYTGTKDYNTSFLDIGEQDAQKATNYLVENLVPGTLYNFKVSGESVCWEGKPTTVDATTNTSGKQKQLQSTKIYYQICVSWWRLKSLYVYCYSYVGLWERIVLFESPKGFEPVAFQNASRAI